MSPRRLPLTPAIVAQLGRVERAAALYPNADDGVAPLELEKLALADLVMDAVQTPQQAAQAARVARLPPRAGSALTVRPRAARRRA